MFTLLQSEVNAGAIAAAGWLVLFVSLAVTAGWYYYVAR